MKRRTISIPESVDALVRELARPGEPYSAAVARLIEAGAEVTGNRRPPAFIGIVDRADVPDDLSVRVEEELRELFARADP